MTSSDGVFLAILAAFYIMLLIGLGFTTLRNGRLFLFILGIFIPLFWLIGALLPATVAAQMERESKTRQ